MIALGSGIDDESLCVIQAPGGAATGFAFMRPEWVATAARVLTGPDGHLDTVPISFLGSDTRDARVLFLHPHEDVAVLEVVGDSPCENPLFPSQARFALGKSFVCVGYSPVLSDAGIARYTSCANPVRSFTWDREAATGGTDRILFDAPWAEAGSAGGPLLGEGGSVVGIVIEAAVSNGRPALRATSIHPLLRHLVFDPAESRR